MASFYQLQGDSIYVPPSALALVPKNKQPIVRVFEALNTNTTMKNDFYTKTAVADILPGIVQRSPLVALFMGGTDGVGSIARWIPVLDSLWELHYLHYCCEMPGLIPGVTRKVYDDALKVYKASLRHLHTALMDDIEDMTHHHGETFTQEELTRFLQRLETFTVRYINIKETLIFHCLLANEKGPIFPLQTCLTPPISGETPSPDKLASIFAASYWERFAGFWFTKNEQLNKLLAKDTNELWKERPFFTLDGLETAHQKCDPALLWRGYLTPKTAAEYLKMFNVD